MPEIPKKDREKIKRVLLEKFDKTLDVNSLADGVPVWKVLFFMLDCINTASFYGTFEWKIIGTKVKDVKITNQTFRSDGIYDINGF